MRIISNPLSVDLPAVHAITGNATNADSYEMISEAIAVLRAWRAGETIVPETFCRALAFWLHLGRGLGVLSSRDVWGSIIFFRKESANTNRPGGKCSSTRRPRGVRHVLVTCNSYRCSHGALVPLESIERPGSMALASVRFKCARCDGRDVNAVAYQSEYRPRA